MQNVDLNLLASLDVLLTERNVTKAARRLGLSPSAMSRTLSRLRVAIGDQLLVQAGRTLVPTLYAEQITKTALRGDVEATFRLGLLPPLASAAAISYKLTGSDKGIW